MLISPEYYLDYIKKFDELSCQKQLNMIKYAKGQITYYQNLLNGKFDNEVAPYIHVDPCPDVYLWWWEQVKSLMEIRNSLSNQTQSKLLNKKDNGIMKKK